MSPRVQSQNAPVVRRRTAVVWVAFIATMTVVGGILLLADPTPAPHLSSTRTALSLDLTGQPSRSVFDTDVVIDANDWVQIVIHHSGNQHGTIEGLARQAQSRGLKSLGHHFVIGNGNGMGDGELHVSYRWMQQLAGAHVSGPNADWNNRHSISVCLVGNGETNEFSDAQMQRLVDLVLGLQREFGIDLDRVLMGSSLSEQRSPGRRFPEQRFREQLRLNG